MIRSRLVAVLLTTLAACSLSVTTTMGATAAHAAPVTGLAVTSIDNEMPAGGVFSSGTAWKLDVTGAPLAANSAGMVTNVATQTAQFYGGVAAFNAYQYSTSFYTVPADQPRVDVLWSNCQGKTYTPAGLLGEGGQFTAVPIPADAVPAKGTDSQMTIYSPSTDQLWEFWVTRKVNGTWTACWGGRIDDVSTSHGYFPGSFGASASGLALAGGTIGIRDVEAGVIDHAIALHLPAPGQSDEFSYPAQRSDGFDTSADRVPEGTRLRLDASIDVDALRLTPIAKMVAKAAQKYGFIVTDRAGCTAVVAESPAAAIAATGVDPWKALMGSTPDYSIMKNFPWGSLQALTKDFGKPAVLGEDETPGGVWTDADPAGMTVSYVSDGSFRTVRNGWGPVERDMSNGEIAATDGRRLKITGVTFAKGLGVHAPSEIVVPTHGATRFTAKVGIDDEVGRHGSAVFQVWNGTTKLADSGTVQGGTGTKPLSVDVSGAQEIRLVVTNNGDGNSGDHADWADARLLTPDGAGSTPTQPSTPVPSPPTGTTTYASDTAYSVIRNGWGPAEPDRSNNELSGTDGNALTIGGQSFDKGFGVHAASEIVVPTGGATTFTAEVGIDDEVLPRGSAVFQVWNGSIKLAESPVMTAGQMAKKLSVDVSAAQEVRLVVTDAGDGTSGDHADWGGARFTSATATTPTTPETSAPTTSSAPGPTSAPEVPTPSPTASMPTGTPTTEPTPTAAPTSTPTATPSTTEPTATPTTTPTPSTTEPTATTTPAPSTTEPMPTPTATPVPRPVSGTAWRTVRNGWGPVERDRSNGEIKAGDGRTLRIAGQSYSTGLGVHAGSEIIVPVAGARSFTALVGIDAEVGAKGSVIFQVWRGSTKIADSGVVRGGQPALPMTVDVSDASEVRLVVTDAGDGTTGDHADWADALLW